MKRMRAQRAIVPIAVLAGLIATESAWAQAAPASYTGPTVAIGNGLAHTVVRTDGTGKAASVGVVMTTGTLEGLPTAAPGADPNFPYHLPMPTTGPKTVFDHVLVNWESAGHPPDKVYDVPHFDFHFYVVSRADVDKVVFAGPEDSGAPSQQPPPELMPAGYILPPGTAVPRMGVHAINPASGEFNQKPFDTTFIYGYYNRALTFVEPMVTLAFLKSKPSFSATVPRPSAYSRPGAYPSSYRVAFDEARQAYEISLEGLE